MVMEIIQTGQYKEMLNNFRAYHADNIARIRELRRYASVGFATVFDLVPVLLNTNNPQTPGFIDDSRTPYGVKLTERQLWLPSGERGGSVTPAPSPVVESLFLIGSSGSVGHTASSDLDYWVCHEPGAFTLETRELFQQKLTAITDWARESHNTEANFYLVDLADLAQGRITHLSDAETEGEVAPQLLLEELYRTFLFVAGRLPLWHGLPVSASEAEYRAVSHELVASHDSEYVDLGFPSLPPPQQILAAALWLARKSEADPFKGIIKIVSLLEYVESNFTRRLICDEIKSSVLTAALHDLPVDHYIVTINRVTEFGAANLSPEQLNLLRIAAAIKILGSVSPRGVFHLPPNSPKRKILRNWASGWGWDESQLDHLSTYTQWPERDQLKLGGELLNMLTSVYIRIAKYLMQHYPGQVNPQNEELAPLAARLLARLGGLDATVETLPSLIHQSAISRRLVMVKKIGGKGGWQLHALDDTRLEPCPDNMVYSAGQAVRVAAWLVHNGIYRPEITLTIAADRAAAGSGGLAMESVLANLAECFPPFNLRHENLETLWSTGGHGQVFLVLNFEIPEEETELVTVDIIMRTGWGEIRHYHIYTGGLTHNADKYLKIANAVIKESGTRPDKLLFHAPQTAHMRKAVMNIRGAIAAVKKLRPESTVKHRIDI